MNRKNLVKLFRISFKDWQADNTPLRAAALTFFIILPLPSLLLIVEAVFAQFNGQTQATQQVIQIITALAGPAVAELFRELLSSGSIAFFIDLDFYYINNFFFSWSHWCFCSFAGYDGCYMGSQTCDKTKVGYKN